MRRTLVDLRKRAEALKEAGFKLESNQSGFSIYFKGGLVACTNEIVPRGKRYSWKEARLSRIKNFELSIQRAEYHQEKQKEVCHG